MLTKLNKYLALILITAPSATLAQQSSITEAFFVDDDLIMIGESLCDAKRDLFVQVGISQTGLSVLSCDLLSEHVGETEMLIAALTSELNPGTYRVAVLQEGPNAKSADKELASFQLTYGVQGPEGPRILLRSPKSSWMCSGRY